MLALWGIHALTAANPAIIPGVAKVTIDGRVLFMTTLITASTAIIFGILPALRAARVDLAGAFRDGDRGATDGHGKHRLRSALVVSEFALALVLLTGAGLMIRAWSRCNTSTRFRSAQRDHHVGLGQEPGREPVLARHFRRGSRARSRAAASSQRPTSIICRSRRRVGFDFAIEGRPSKTRRRARRTGWYFLDILARCASILRGRDVNESDRAGSPKVVVINEYMAKTHWPGRRIGKRITMDDSTWVTIVGITKNTVRSSWAAPAGRILLPVLSVAVFHR